MTKVRNTLGIIYTVLYEDDTGYLLEDATGYRAYSSYKDSFTEVKEPRKAPTLFMNVFVNMYEPDKLWISNTGHRTREAAQQYAEFYVSGATLVDTIEITYTEKV